ncbi:MAG: nucleotidyltransferase domain-containing protein [Alphaproteobacteria bacterium]|nr:nucleotidyltransferase domain-containing protein [Alphaproteobacteria bacterium]
MSLTWGLSNEIVGQLREALAAQPRLRRAALFGSRARGDCRPDSDIDLAVYGDEDFSFRDYLDLAGRMDDLPVVFKIDVVDMNRLDNMALQSEIEREGVAFWEAESRVTGKLK